MKLNSKNLLITTLLYIYIPVAIFLIGFTAVWVWIITLAVGGYFGYKMYTEYCENMGDDICISWPVFAVVVSVIVIVCVLIGYGGIFPQAGDWYKHNAVLHDLINKSWPVYYTSNEESMLTYYLGQYLVPAIIGKLAGNLLVHNSNSDIAFAVAEFAMAAWGIVGIVLVYLNLARITLADTVTKQIRMIWILLFFCGALPVAQIVCNDIFGDNMYSLGSHHWLLANGLMLQYRSNLVMLRWVYPQVIVIWLIIILFMENKKKLNHYVLLLLPILLYGTFSIVVMAILAVGYAIFCLIKSKDKLPVVKNVLSLSNIFVALTLGVVLVAYFWGYIQVDKPDYMSFQVIDINFTRIVNILIFDLFMFGIFSICVYPRQKKSYIYYAVNVLLAVIPFFTMGIFNDWIMGTSIPGLFIILIYVVDMLNANDSLTKDSGKSKKYAILSSVIIVTLLIGSWYPLMEIKENIVAYVPGDNTWDGYGSLEQYSDRNSEESEDLIYNYYTYDLDGKFFYEYLAANKIEDSSTSGVVKKKKLSVSGIYFDTYISITSYDDTTQEILDGALEKCDEYSSIFSKTDSGSEVYKINSRQNNMSNEEGIYRTEISEDLRNVLEAGIKYGELTGDRFNIAMGTVTKLWDFQSGNGTVPEEELIDEALEHIDYSCISIDGNILEITDSRIELDLGGIAKGYIANELREYFLENGSNSLLIALGGNIMCIGDKGDSGFTVGIQKPYGGQGEAITSIEVSDTSVVSSGVYERYFEQDGIKYHHILNPVTGYSANTDIDGVSVVCKDSMKADILSTTLLMLGREYGMEYLDTINDSIDGEPITEVVFVSDSGKITYWNYDDEEK